MFGFLSFYSFLTLSIILLNVFIGRKNKIEDAYYACICVCLFIFAACRGEEVGGDLENYIPQFLNTQYYNSLIELLQYSVISGYEFGFILLAKLVNLLFGESPRAFIVVSSFISLIGPFCFIGKYSSNRVFSIVLYCLAFYILSFNSVRQHIALSIVAFSLCFLLNNKKVKFFIGVILATSVHTSAIFSILFLPLFVLKFSFKGILHFFIYMVLAILLAGPIIFVYLKANIFTKYLDNPSDALVSGTGYSLLLVNLVVFFAITFLFMNVKKRMNIEMFNINIFFYGSLMLAVIVQMSTPLMANIMRLTYYFSLSTLVLLPNLISYSKKRNRNILYISTFFFYYLLSCITIFSLKKGTMSNSSGTIPYVFMDSIFSW